MKISITQEELTDIVRDHYNISSTTSLRVTIVPDSVSECTVKLSSAGREVLNKKTVPAANPHSADVADLLSDVSGINKSVPIPKGKKKRKFTRPGSGIVHVPKETTVDYFKYAEMIDNFLRSSDDTFVIPPEDGITDSGLAFRCRTASEMYGYRHRITQCVHRGQRGVVLGRK